MTFTGGKKMPKAPKRKPAEKFVRRRFSERRIARIHGIPPKNRANIEKVFAASANAAEKLLQRLPLPRNGRMVFVGQAMFPLFEAVRAINEIEQVHQRRNITYFISPITYQFAENFDMAKTVQIATKIMKKKLNR